MDKILSIIVPSYNMEAYLPKCLGSLVVDDRQLFEKLDVIVVNDGSKDRTSEIAHDYEANYPGVFRVIDKENGHYGSCINAALPVMSGTFVKVLDADDSFDRLGFVKFLCFLENADENVDVVFTQRVYVDEHDNVTKTEVLDMPTAGTFGLHVLAYQSIADIWHHHVTYRTSLFRKIDYHQLEGLLYTDAQWVFYPMSVARGAQYFPIVVYRYFMGREGQSVKPETYVRNLSHTRRVTEQLMEDYPALIQKSTTGGAFYIRERLFSRIMLVYRFHLFKHRNELLGEEKALLAFDAKLRKAVPELYRRSGKMRYLRRIPIGYVAAWRWKSKAFPLPSWILWSLCAPLAKWRGALCGSTLSK